MELLSQAIGWSSLVLGIICVALGLLLAWSQRNAKPPERPKPGLGEQAGVTEAIKATTDFAKALKDLDRSGQLLIIGVLFFAIAGLVAGLESVANAIESTAGATSP